MDITDERLEAGLRVRQALGMEPSEATVRRAAPGSVRGAFWELINEVVFGAVWSRPGLEMKTRSFITLAVLTAMGKSDELPIHIRAALHQGLTRDEISELMLHVAFYAGVPAGVEGLRAVGEVFREQDGASEAR